MLINLVPSLNSIFLFIFIILIGLLLASIPASKIFSINFFVDLKGYLSLYLIQKKIIEVLK